MTEEVREAAAPTPTRHAALLIGPFTLGALLIAAPLVVQESPPMLPEGLFVADSIDDMVLVAKSDSIWTLNLSCTHLMLEASGNPSWGRTFISYSRRRSDGVTSSHSSTVPYEVWADTIRISVWERVFTVAGDTLTLHPPVDGADGFSRWIRIGDSEHGRFEAGILGAWFLCL